MVFLSSNALDLIKLDIVIIDYDYLPILYLHTTVSYLADERPGSLYRV